MILTRGLGAMPTGPTTINILTGAPISPGTSAAAAGQVPAVMPGGTGTGPSGYTFNPDGSVTWFDALGNPITDVSAYNAAVSPGDIGLPALAGPSSFPWSTLALVGAFAFAGWALSQR